MEKKDVEEIVNERTGKWENFDGEKKAQIVDFAMEVLERSKELGIPFDRSAGITFVSHLATLYQRLFLTDERVTIDGCLFDQIPGELLEMGEEMGQIAEKYFGKELDASEKFLIATHMGAMRERIRQGVTD